MDDELLAGAPPLVGVMLAGKHERGGDRVAVDRDERLLGVFLDDREEVGQQLALACGEERELRVARRRDLLYAARAVVISRYLRPSSRVCS